jgi:hypothetical protein
VEEERPSAAPRVVVAASMAVAAGAAPTTDLEHIAVEVLGGWLVRLRLGDEESCVLALGPSPVRELGVGRRRISGPALRVVRARLDDTGFAGERIAAIEGVVELDPPGPVSLRRMPDGSITVTTSSGIRLDPAWATRPLRSLRIEPGTEREAAVRLDEALVVPRSTIRRLQRRSGSTLVEIEVRS